MVARHVGGSVQPVLTRLVRQRRPHIRAQFSLVHSTGLSSQMYSDALSISSLTHTGASFDATQAALAGSHQQTGQCALERAGGLDGGQDCMNAS